jgi:hypothetical protein
MTDQSSAAPKLAHMVFFLLADNGAQFARDFMEACIKYLSPVAGHNGQYHFSVGLRDVDIARDVSATDFDVAMHIIFDDQKSYDLYSKSEEHEDFITATAGMSPSRKVLDSFLYVCDPKMTATEDTSP